MFEASQRPRGKVWGLVRVEIVNIVMWPLLSHFQVGVRHPLGLSVFNFVMWPPLRQARVKVFTWSQ